MTLPIKKRINTELFIEKRGVRKVRAKVKRLKLFAPKNNNRYGNEKPQQQPVLK